jgi:F-type H+-transporting ATPase subunit alpha
LGERIVAVLKQSNNAPVEVAHQVCILYAVVKGYLENIDVSKIPEFERRLQEFMETRYEDVLVAIRTTGKLETVTEDRLKEALTQLLAEMGG